MTDEQRGATILFKLELRRAMPSVLRGLITPVLLVAWGSIGSDSRPDLVLAGLFGALAITATAVAFQVGRDRNDGTLAYFATLPIRGEYLAGIRFMTVAALSATMAALLVVPGHLLFPEIPWVTTLRIATMASVLAMVAGWVLIAPLTKLDWATVLSGLMATALAAGFVLDKSGLGSRASSYLGSVLKSGNLGALAATVAVLVWFGGVLAALGAFVYTSRSMQPNGRVPTQRAQSLLDHRGR